MVVETDVIIRFLTNDDPSKAERFEKYLKTGKKIVLNDVTVAEIYWTLKSFYQLDKDTILDLLDSLVAHPSISCDHTLLQTAFGILRINNLSYADAYTLAFALLEDDSHILSYDRGLDRVNGVIRDEP